MATRPLDLSQERRRGREKGRKEREGRVGVGAGTHTGRRTQRQTEWERSGDTQRKPGEWSKGRGDTSRKMKLKPNCATKLWSELQRENSLKGKQQPSPDFLLLCRSK